MTHLDSEMTVSAIASDRLIVTALGALVAFRRQLPDLGDTDLHYSLPLEPDLLDGRSRIVG